MLKLEDFKAAKKRVDEVILETHLIHSDAFSEECGNDVYIKPENLQRTGAFKIRGAYNKIVKLDDEAKKRGLIASSAGNHAQGVAYAANKLGVKATIVMPSHTPLIKVEATKAHGAEVVLAGEVYDDAYAKAVELQESEGYTFVHPFDDEDVMEGQGTIALEILDELPDTDMILVPIGGGGLISGLAFAIKSLNPKVKIYGVQAEGAASMVNSVHDHHPETLPSVSTIADGIAVKSPGTITFQTCSKYVDDIVTVTEDEICAAILKLIESEKMVAEGAGAASVAAVMYNKVPVKGKKTVCIVSGGNIDVTILNRVIYRGLAKSGRVCTLDMELDDQPGKLVEVCSVIAQLGGNITGVHHDRSANRKKVNACILRVTLETRNEEHIHEIKQALVNSGINIL